MTDYEFTLRFRITDSSVGIDDRLERLFEAGCDDSLPGIGRSGSIALAFTRSSESARDAILSALASALGAMPDATLIGASPDLVGLTDIARIMGFSRQNMRKLMLGGVEPGPAPVHESAPSLWHLADALTWLGGRGYSVDQALIDVAVVTMQVNLALELTRADPAAQRAIQKALA
ncbi:MAG: DNA-binding protein [Coriobacteriia bacterium]|nr:DNA-binding protein [Coriobacteriia bacterium]